MGNAATDPHVSEISAGLRDRLEALYGGRFEKLVLFGSHARGDARDGSDVDFLVVLDGFRNVEEELERMDPIASEISLRHDVLICLSVVRLEDYRSRPSGMMINVRREGVTI